MTTIKTTRHYAYDANMQAHEQREAYRIMQRRFDDFKTLLFAMVVACPIATVVGMVIGDWFMIALALAIVSACGLASLYLLRRLEKTILGR